MRGVRGEHVTVDTDGGQRVRIELSELGARRLMLALGVHTKRYGPEVSQLLTGLARLLIGSPTSALETSHPHGPGHPCPLCEEVFR